MSSTQQTPQTSFPTSTAQINAHCGGADNILKVIFLKSLKNNIKPEKAKMKTPEQTIGLRVGNFLKRQFKLYKSEKPLNKRTKGISLKNNGLKNLIPYFTNELKKIIFPIVIPAKAGIRMPAFAGMTERAGNYPASRLAFLRSCGQRYFLRRRSDCGVTSRSSSSLI